MTQGSLSPGGGGGGGAFYPMTRVPFFGLGKQIILHDEQENKA